MKHGNTQQNQKSGYILATPGSVASSGDTPQVAAKSKTSANYWLGKGRLFKFERRNSKGVKVPDADYSCRISFGGRRDQFQLHTANQAAAASKAATLYRDIVGKGWEDAMRIHKPKALPKVLTLPRNEHPPSNARHLPADTARSPVLHEHAWR